MPWKDYSTKVFLNGLPSWSLSWHSWPCGNEPWNYDDVHCPSAPKVACASLQLSQNDGFTFAIPFLRLSHGLAHGGTSKRKACASRHKSPIPWTPTAGIHDLRFQWTRLRLGGAVPSLWHREEAAARPQVGWWVSWGRVVRCKPRKCENYCLPPPERWNVQPFDTVMLEVFCEN